MHQIKAPFPAIFLILVTGILLSNCQQKNKQAYSTRTDFNARLEPDNKIISGAGQSRKAFKNYTTVMDSTTQPVLYMTYTDLKGKKFKDYDFISNECKQYSWFIIPQIGLSMTKDGSPEKHYEDEVAAGKHDTSITALCKALEHLNRPVFLRIGYEFNGHWNGYHPSTYKKAFMRITDSLRKYELNQVATIWCASPDGKAKQFMKYYPGDEYVDWWSVDIFGVDHFTDTLTHRFLDSAYKHQKPVMIGESTPRKVGVRQGDSSWNQWFKPYFELIQNHSHIKAFSYINWNWSKYERWDDWGDCRLGQDSTVARKFLRELQSNIYMHGGSREETYQQLHMPSPSQSGNP